MYHNITRSVPESTALGTKVQAAGRIFADEAALDEGCFVLIAEDKEAKYANLVTVDCS